MSPGVDTLPAGASRQFTVLWSSSAPDIASVSPDGLVAGRASGDATITALVADQRGTAAIRVERRFSAVAVAVGSSRAAAGRPSPHPRSAAPPSRPSA